MVSGRPVGFVAFLLLQDTFKNYKTESIQNGKDYFKDLEQINKTGKTKGGVKEHNMLSQSYRRAATITLSFLFPFYGW